MKRWIKFLLQLSAATAVSCASAGSYEDFFKAVELNRPAMMRDLLQRGFDPNTPNPKGQTGLILALRGEADDVVRALLAHPDIRVDQANASGETPLMMAAIHGRTAWVKVLLARGAQVNREGWTPLHYAASGPDAAVIGLLLDAGALIDAPSPNRSTPLMMAARYGSEDNVMLLLKRGADPAVRNDRALNAADFAREAGRDSLARRIEAATPR